MATNTRTAGVLVLLAIGVAHTAPCAQGVQTYGQIRLTVNRIDSAGSRSYEVRDNASRLGFRGSEDLGDGAAALFGLEMGIEADTGAATTPTYRNSYVGLRSGWGTLALGRLDSANPTGSPLYSQVTAIVSFAPNDAGATAIGTSMLAARNRVSNAIGYRSPGMGGFELMVRGYLRGAGTATESEHSARSLDLGLMYRSGPLTAALGYGKDERAGGLQANEFDDKWQAGLRWSFGFVIPYVMLGTDRFDSSGTRRRSVDYRLLGMELPFGPHTVVLNVMEKDVQTSLSGTRKRQQVAYLYRLSKRTQLQAFWDNDGVDSSRSNVRVRAVGSGIRHDF
jgi:predicted porin